MLLQLPVEVIIRFSFYLETYEKIALMQTCKHMERIIGDHCLLSKVDLLDNTQARNFMNFLEKNETKKTQVRELLLGRETSGIFSLSKIPETFPKLEKLTWKYAYFPWSLKKDGPMDLSAFQNLKESLRKICSKSAGYMVHDILKQSVFPKLTNIVISMEDAFNKSYSNAITNDFIEALKNAPNLNKLTFESVKFSVETIELLHQCAPNIKELTFDECSFESTPEEVDAEKERFKLRIRPNRTLTELNITGNCSIDGKGMWWLDYISKKYEVLETLKMESYIECCGRDTATPLGIATCEKALLKLLSGCPTTLKSFYVNRYPMSEKVFSVIDQRGFQLTDTHLEGGENYKEDRLDAFFNSEQVKSVELLTIDDLHINRKISFKNVKKLKHLRISFCGDKQSYKYVYLDTLLKECPPGLEKLEIRCNRVTVTTDIHRTGSYKIKLLRLFGNVDKSVYPFLNKHCKRITDLGFDLSSYRRPARQPNTIPIVDINLSKLDLKLFTFHIRDCALYCIVKCEKQTKYYRLNPKSDVRELRVKKLDDKKVKDVNTKKHISVECKSVQFLYINGLHIY